ncbi:MAG: phosphotransacetylase [Gemmatimonadetes bacterium]|nr:phosphotransacetylase [Gemmatimonadota bacterium]
MPAFLETLAQRAATRQRRIAFPEADDPRVREAILALHERRTIHPVVVAAPSMDATPFRSAGIEVVHPLTDPRAAGFAADLHARRRARGMDLDEAARRLRDPLFFADALVASGAVDGCVAGAVSTTADVLRAALWVVGPDEGASTVSSAFYMVVPPFRGSASEVLTFTDGAVVPEPTATQLADIAVSAARDRSRIVGDMPVVAFLSYATHLSASGAAVDRVRDAMALFRQRMPDVPVDGPMQVDAALIEAISARKAPGSPIAGRANVLIFPSLEAGNIGYKLVERLAHATAVGPIIQGLRRPCCDLSRGASSGDIMAVAAITALQA